MYTHDDATPVVLARTGVEHHALSTKSVWTEVQGPWHPHKCVSGTLSCRPDKIILRVFSRTPTFSSQRLRLLPLTCKNRLWGLSHAKGAWRRSRRSSNISGQWPFLLFSVLVHFLQGFGCTPKYFVALCFACKFSLRYHHGKWHHATILASLTHWFVQSAHGKRNRRISCSLRRRMRSRKTNKQINHL